MDLDYNTLQAFGEAYYTHVKLAGTALDAYKATEYLEASGILEELKKGSND